MKEWILIIFVSVFFILGIRTQTLETTINTTENVFQPEKPVEQLDSENVKSLHLSKKFVEQGNLDSAKIYFQSVHSQNLSSTISKGLYQEVKGLQLFEEGQYLSALKAFHQAIKFYQNDSAQSQQWNILENENNIGRTWITLNELDSAKNLYRHIFRAVRSISPHDIDSLLLSKMYNNMGVVFFYEGNLDSAYSYYDQSRTIAYRAASPNHINVGRALYNMGLVKEEKGFLVDAGLLYQKALEVYEKNLDSNHHHIAEVYGSLGNIHLTRYEFQKARYYFQKDLETSKQIYGDGHIETSWGYENMGRLYQAEGNDSLAKMMFEKSLEIRNQFYHGKSIYISNVLLSLAEVEKNSTQSILLAKKALTVENSVTTQPTIGKWNITNHLIEKYIDVKNYKQAQLEYEKSLFIGEKIFPQKRHVLFVRTYLLGARIQTEQNLYEKSLSYIDKAIESALAENVHWNPNEEIQVHEVEFIPEYLSAVQEKANVLYKIGSASSNVEILKQASSLYSGTNAVIQKHQKRRTSDDISKKFFSLYKGIYESGLKVNFQIWQLTGEKQYLNTAFEYAERIKNGPKQDLLQGMDVFTISNIPEATLRKEYQLKKDIQYYQSLSQESDSILQDQITPKLFNLYREEEKFYRKLKKFHPEYFQAKYNFTPLSLEDVQQKLFLKNELVWHSTFIDGEEFLFLIQDQKVNAFRREKSPYSAKEFNLIDKDCKKIIVIPDFSSQWINLEAYKLNGKFLIEKYSCIYNTSVSQYYIPAQTNKLINKKILAIAPIDFEQSDLSSLKYSNAEIGELEKYFSVVSFTGKEATKEVFNKNLVRYGGLHLLSHISYNFHNPLMSKLYLSPKDSSEDGVLYAHDIFGTPMRTHLVTLSACDAKKDQQKNLGIAGIADAFAYNGCQNILYTLWKVEDKTMKEITVNFYKYLSEGYSKEKALQMSKIEYLKHADKYKSQSFYWSGILLQGDSQRLALSPSYWARHWWWVALAIFIIVLIINRKF